MLVIGGAVGAVVVFAGGDDRLGRAELVSRVETLCGDFRDDSPDLDEVTSTSDLQAAVDERQPLLDELVAEFESLQPPEAEEAAFDRFVDRAGDLRDLNEELGELLGPETTFGDVIDLLARGLTASAAANEASEDFGAEPCDDPDAEPITAEEMRRQLGEAFFTLAAIPDAGAAEVACVTDGFVRLPLDVVLSFQDAGEADLPAGAVADLAAMLDECVPLVPVLEQTFLAEGIPPETAFCLADEVAFRIGWEGVLQAGLGENAAALEQVIVDAAAVCPGLDAGLPSDPFDEF